MLFLSFLLLSYPSLIFPITSIQPPFLSQFYPPLFCRWPPSLHTLMPTPSMTDFTQYTQDFLFYSPELELELPTSGSVVHLTTQADHANLP